MNADATAYSDPDTNDAPTANSLDIKYSAFRLRPEPQPIAYLHLPNGKAVQVTGRSSCEVPKSE